MRITDISQSGSDGNTAYNPFGGGVQAVFSRFQSVSPTDLKLLLYLFGLTATAGIVAGYLLHSGIGLGHPEVVVLLAVVAAVGERASVSLTSTIDSSISIVPTVFAAVLFGPLAAMVVGAASMAGDFRRPFMRSLIYTSTRALGGAAAGIAAGVGAEVTDSAIGSIAVATTLGGLVAETLDAAFAVTTLRFRGRSALESARTLAPVVATSVAIHTPVIALLAYAYSEISPWILPLFLVPGLAAQHLFVLLQKQRSLTDDLLAANTRLERASLSFATALVRTLDARDRYTAGHSAAVAIYSRDIADRMGLPADDQRRAHVCGLVHDIGKVGLPAGLLEKAGPLSLAERRQMERHSEIGERILAEVDDYAEIASVVRHHHERVDGRGYPDGLCGDHIPLLARIIAVADAYNAMTSDRPYRDAMPSRVARLRLAQAVETQFDTAVVAAFEAVLAGSDENYRTGTAPEFDLVSQSSIATAAARTAAA